MVDNTTIVVERPRKDPWGLRRIAEERGTEPLALLVDVLSRNATYDAAARELGVTQRALRNWRRRYRIEG